ncbi:MAG TPA: ABC transporter ATP-binding protein [Solirubrobacterales bacterium]|nr:ABC transporter ATP-binding protein [Solirubrobacterales bacterium]
MGNVAIEAKELGKSYRLGLGARGYDTLREGMVNAVRRSLGRFGRRREQRPEDEELQLLWALRDVSLTIRSGEVVGLIGHNGAGKSTLLKILSRIVEPSTGYVDVTGRAGSLLEVGTGFHPELTGRENIFLNGAVLGMRRAEIRARFDEIVAFADIERFLDTPVKRYSSGMSVRLAFAVAAHLEPEILLVDEVLAVGDAAFQRKSLAKMSEVAQEGRTVVFVSHNLAVIQALCQRGVLLEQGKVIADAPIAEAIDGYLRTLERSAADDLTERSDYDSRSWGEILVRRVAVQDARSGQLDVAVGGRPAKVVLELTGVLPMTECQITIVNSLGQPVATLDSEVSAPSDVRDPELGPRIECEIEDLPLIPGRYRIDFVVKGRRQIQHGLQAAAFFDVEPGVLGERPMPVAGADGDVVLPHRWHLPA